ncbi:protein ACCELERATED CELL DEATH 6-like [Solanum dulcamara]|uniref:protein ACCELERATED CELL DEATH 6-like n=1 Tax=Solanum dulcamara TaxID=45834 RepID=UPI0024853867|nr:protein ACCELERATED CELL DEATH 6-like [Solanum dulcamara]
MNSDDNETREIKDIKDKAQTNLVVATLLVTLTFAAGFTLPGGFESDRDSPHKGMAILVKKPAFCAFVITDAIGFVCSVGAVLSYLIMAVIRLPTTRRELKLLIKLSWVAASLQFLSMFSVVIAFVTGLSATLAHSVGLATAVCAIGCSFFLIYMLIGYVITKAKEEPVIGSPSFV